jgi:hypothetical protein
MASLNFIGGEKGGVGKSVTARVVAQFLIDEKHPFVGFDTDRSHASFTRFYGDYASPIIIDSYQSMDHIAEAITQHPERHVLVDLAAQTFPALLAWLDDSGVLPLLASEGIAVRFWHVMDDGMDSIALLDRLLYTLPPHAQVIVVLNHGRGNDFSNFHDSVSKARAQERQAKILELRRLHESTMRSIDLHNASFWSAINHRGSVGSLGLFERQRVKIWLAKTFADLHSIF